MLNQIGAQRFTLVEKDSNSIIDSKNLFFSQINKKIDSENQNKQADLDNKEIEINEEESGFKTGKSSFAEIPMPMPMLDTEIIIGNGVISSERIDNQMDKKAKSSKANEDDIGKDMVKIEKRGCCWCFKTNKKGVEKVSNDIINDNQGDKQSEDKLSLYNNLNENLIQTS